MRFATFAMAAAASLLLVACGGGGSSSDSAVEATSAAALLPAAGGTLRLGDKDMVVIAADTLAASANVEVKLIAAKDAAALAAHDTQVTLPIGKMLSNPLASVTVFVYPDIQGGTAGRELSKALQPGLNVGGLTAMVTTTANSTPMLSTPVTLDVARQAYKVVINGAQLARIVATTFANEVAVQADAVVQLSVNFVATSLGTLSTETRMYRWSSLDAVEPLAETQDEGVDLAKKGLTPLVLVHGIVGFPGLGVCGANSFYKATWREVAKRFVGDTADKDLAAKFALYTFSYPTNLGIKSNGSALKRAIQAHFKGQPAVVLSHSMGGLVTWAADADFAVSNDTTMHAAIKGVVTLDTPYLGTPNIAALAHDLQSGCPFDPMSQGARELIWWSESNNPALCDNELLCGANGLHQSKALLKKYVPYSATFDLPSAKFETPGKWSLWPRDEMVELDKYFDRHGAYGISRVGQVVTQLERARKLGVLASTEGDGAVLRSSQRFQSWDGSAWQDPAFFRRLPMTYLGLDHSSVHDEAAVFESEADGTPGGLKADLLGFVASPLTLKSSGTGVGTIRLDGQAICTSPCASTTFQKTDSTVTLTAASSDSTFMGWSGACSGTATCVVKMSAAASVSAKFERVPSTMVFEDNFDAAALDGSRWLTERLTGCCGTGVLAAMDLSGGFLNINVTGGSCGFCGVSDGVRLLPKLAPLQGDFAVTLRAKEVLRLSRDRSRPLSNLGLTLAGGNAELGLYVQGDVASNQGVPGHALIAYHRVGNTLIYPFRKELTVGTYYTLEMRILRMGSKVVFGYRFDPAQPWIDSVTEPSLPTSQTFSPRLTAASGDGGGTSANSQFMASVDYLRVTQ